MTLGSGDTGGRLKAYRLKEAALRSASDRELLIRALYGFDLVLQGHPVNERHGPHYCCGIDFDVHSTALLSAMEKALQFFWP